MGNMEKSKGKEIAEALSKLVNIMSNDEEEEAFINVVLTDHRTLQQKMARIFLQCVVRWSKDFDRGWYDLRNEQTVKICKKITELLKEEDIVFDDKVSLPYI